MLPTLAYPHYAANRRGCNPFSRAIHAKDAQRELKPTPALPLRTFASLRPCVESLPPHSVRKGQLRLDLAVGATVDGSLRGVRFGQQRGEFVHLRDDLLAELLRVEAVIVPAQLEQLAVRAHLLDAPEIGRASCRERV